MARACRVCNAAADSFARAVILGKHDIEYQRCTDCGLIQTETPHWLEEAYCDAIISTDVGLVWRNQRFAKITSRVLRHVYPSGYYALDGGQHVALWTERALQAVASQYGRQLVTTRAGLHLLSKEPVSRFWATAILRGRGAFLLDRLRKRRSLLHTDYRAALANVAEKQSVGRAAA